MHAVTPYLVRSYRGRDAETKQPEYHKLSDINNIDLLELIHQFMTSKSGSVFDFAEDKKVYQFLDINYDKQRRTVSASMCAGSYGVKSDILDISTGKLRFPKTETDAEILRHYIQFTIPTNKTEAVALFHKSHSVGIKTLFDSLFKPFFRNKTNSSIQIAPYAHGEAIREWIDNAVVKRICVKGYQPSSDITDNLNSGIELNNEFIIKPRRTSSSSMLGRLADFIGPDASEPAQNMVAVLSQHGQSVKTVAQLNGTTRSFTVGTDSSSGTTCDIELDSDSGVTLDGGQPDHHEMHAWCINLTNDILKGVYGKRAPQIAPISN
ncbi:MAG: hypothetical protein MK088_07635 [Alteromonas sp.]|nr:hypothetical protein [Alteromonas sp.]